MGVWPDSNDVAGCILCSVGPLDPSRLAAAAALIDVLFPRSTMEQMVDGMLKPMLTNMRRGIEGNPQFAKAMASDQRLKALFDQFMDKQNARAAVLLHEAMPEIRPVMAHAYARRFSIAQIAEIQAFFTTPTGRFYMQQSLTMMSDPDVAAWQSSLMTRAMAHVQDEAVEFGKQVAAIAKEDKK